MKSTKWLINLGVILVFATLLGIIFSATDAAGPLTTFANTPRQELDFGDAPDPTYPTLQNSNGAYHQIMEGIHLGDFIDGEADGSPDAAALGDDLDQDPDDEDGGLFSSPLFAGQIADLDVVASTDGKLDAWLDFNQDGDWDDNGEQIFLAQELTTGPNSLTFIVPHGAATGLTFSRLRFSLEGGLSFDGPAPEGEVEDYRVDIQIPSPEPAWAKWVNDEPWFPELLVNVETSQTITVTDVITTFADFRLHEDWDPAHLTLLDVTVTDGDVERREDSLEWSGVAPASGVVTLTKWFHVEPCTWDVTVLSETLEVPIVPFPERPVIIEKEAPVLWIDVDDHDPEVVAGLPTTFTLLYGNDGGYENDVMIRNDFPPEAPFASSEPEPNRQDPEGLWVEWDVGDLGKGHQDRISVTVAIDPLLEPTTILTVTDVIYDHVDEPADQVEIPFQVTEPHKAEWEKLVNGQTWVPEMTVTLQTSQTFTVTDVITTHPKARFILRETWNPEHLTLRNAYVDPPEASRLISAPGSLEWHAGVDHAETITLTKVFHVEPCDWPNTVLLEELVGLQVPDAVRPVTINKMPPILWIDVDDYDPEVAAADLVSFTLLYGNDGGYENDVMIRNDFPPGAPFVSSDPAPDRQNPEGLWVEWDIGDLEMEQKDRISVTVAISPLLPVSSQVTIVDVIYDHTGEQIDSVEIPFHVARPPAGEWKKQVNGRTWVPEMAVTLQTSQTFTVTDIITTHPGAPFYLAEAWNPDHLTLQEAYVDPPEAPQPSSGAGSLDWRVGPDHAEVITLSKVFHVEPCNWPSTILEETLEGLTVLDPVRPVTINKMSPILWIDVDDYSSEVAAGDLVSFTLLYGNDGGYENDVMIRNNFPPGAPFASSDPAPDRQDPEGLWVEWDVGDLEMEQEDRISVTVAISPLLPISGQVTIVDVIYDHTGEQIDSVEIPFHVARPPAGEWKKQVNGRTWIPDMTFNVQPSQTITVTDVVTTLAGAPFYLAEAWNPDHLTLQEAYVDPSEAPQPSSGMGSLEWRVDPDHAEVITLTKVFHVEPGNWRTTVLHEELEGLDVTNPIREVSFTAPFRLFLPIIERNYPSTALDGQRQALAETPARPPTRLSRRRTMRR
jgi:hypothetical protein